MVKYMHDYHKEHSKGLGNIEFKLPSGIYLVLFKYYIAASLFSQTLLYR